MTDGINDAVVPPADDAATDGMKTPTMPDPMAETPEEGVEAPKEDGEEGEEEGEKDPMADDADEEATPATPAL